MLSPHPGSPSEPAYWPNPFGASRTLFIHFGTGHFGYIHTVEQYHSAYRLLLPSIPHNVHALQSASSHRPPPYSSPTPKMMPIGQPLYFEDQTGSHTNTDLDDIYDRMFFRVVHHKSTGAVLIYDRGRRSRRNSGPETMPPNVVLDFGPKHNALGTITIDKLPPMPMKDFLRKIGTWGR